MSDPADVPPFNPTTRPKGLVPRESWGQIRLAGPDSLVAAAPHLVGFPPRGSLVLLGVGTDRAGRSEELVCVARVELPPAKQSLGEVTAYTRQVVAPLARAGATTIVALVYHDAVPDPDRPLPYAALVDQLVLEIDEHQMWPGAMLYTDGTTHWSYGCQDPTCCPPAGRVVPERIRTWVAAQFTAAGVAVAASRDHLDAELAPDPGRVTQVGEHLATLSPPSDFEAWRDRAIATISGLDPATAPTAATCADVLAGLDDIRVRDTILWDLAQPRTDRHATRNSLRAVMTGAPTGHVAPVATVLAIQHWQAGDGARANACLDRALTDNPDYGLANLTAAAVRAGMPPSAWAAAMSALDRDSCRHGFAARPPVTSQAAVASIPKLDTAVGMAQC